MTVSLPSSYMCPLPLHCEGGHLYRPQFSLENGTRDKSFYSHRNHWKH